MKFGVREICDVTLRAKHGMTLGNIKFEKDMPVLYFDSLKTSSLEGAATTVYAQGGKGNVRLIAWEGEKTLTFNMEDALISKESLAVLSGAGLIVNETKAIPVHTVETTTLEDNNVVYLTNAPLPQDDAHSIYAYVIPLDQHGDINGAPRRILLSAEEGAAAESDGRIKCTITGSNFDIEKDTFIMVDYYYGRTGVSEINITPDKFAGYFYLEASTLFRNKTGIDLPAEFIIPNCKIQSNFTFSMAPTGDPSTFSFVLDAFPDYTKYDKTKKVLATIQIIEEDEVATDEVSGYAANASKLSKWGEETASSTTEETPATPVADPEASGSSFRSNRVLKSND